MITKEQIIKDMKTAKSIWEDTLKQLPNQEF